MKLFNKRNIEFNFKNLILFNEKLIRLLSKDKYISKREYLNDLDTVKDEFNQVKLLNKTNSLKKICKNNRINYNEILTVINNIESIEQLIKSHNDKFINDHLIKDKDYFDCILSKIDPNIKLDDEQRIVALNDEDYSLIIAGAGAGKTTTLSAKVKYLVDKLNINPEEILIIAFTNKAVEELKEKINNKLGLNIPISTFHSCGRAILKKDQDLTNANVLTDNFYFISKFLSNEIQKDSSLLSNLIMLFAYYIDLPPEIIGNISMEDHFSFVERNDFTTLKGNIGEYIKDYTNVQSRKKISIKNEYLKSVEEVQIANFLYMNSIEYEYEKIYPYPIPNAYKLYTPDFYIKQGDKECYIEHFGITEDLKNDRYTKKELEKYVLRMNYKISHHSIHKTDLITTFSSYIDNKSLLTHLEEELIKKGFKLQKRNEEEVYLKIKENKDNKYIFKFTKMASTFIGLFKNKNYKLEDFEKLKNSTKNPRNLLFLNIMEKIYLAYELYLKDTKQIDFYDMINKSSLLLQEAKKVRDQINFKYVLIDEFQDISRSRIELVSQIRDATNAKICVVGDDWQAIYSYAGADINLFTKFEEIMGYASTLRITKTYRNSQELIDIAGNFIQKNNNQIKKQLISNKSIDKPITIYTYDGSWKSKDNKGADYNKAVLLDKVINLITKLDGQDSNILVIGRYNFDGNHLLETGLFELVSKSKNIFKSVKYPSIKLTFMTAHATKGLTYDNVIIINMLNGRYGFPSQIDDDPLFNFVRTKDESYDFSEERRLFYVALTRTKNRVFLLAPYQNPSKFILELLEDYSSDKVNIQEDKAHPLNRNIELIGSKRTKCPVCGYPMQLRENKNYGLKLYICTNEPEICDYMTNNLKSGKIGIHLCKKCNGVMHVKPKKDKSGYIFGCSNYKPDKSGCNNVEDLYNNNEDGLYVGMVVKHNMFGFGEIKDIDEKYLYVCFDKSRYNKKFEITTFDQYFKKI